MIEREGEKDQEIGRRKSTRREGGKRVGRKKGNKFSFKSFPGIMSYYP